MLAPTLSVITMKKIAVFFLSVAFCAGLYAQQKFGHLNTGNLLEQLPEVALADSLLVKYQDSLATNGQKLVEKFETDYKAYIEEANKGTIPPVQAQQKEAALQKQQQEIEAYRQNMEEKIGARRQAYLKPILTKVDAAIKTVGKEKNYAFIFDTSTGAMLYAMESEDVTSFVKEKLGIK
jgi:outer membrane protein